MKRLERWKHIEAVVSKLGEASRGQIERDLPPEVSLSGVALGKVLRRMEAGHRLEKARHGVYRLHPNHELRAQSSFEFMERQIDWALRDCGGIAKREDIDLALWGHRRGRKERPYEFNLVTRVLRESPTFRQDFGYGYWNLDLEERAKLPLPGYWAARQLDEAADFDQSTSPSEDFFRVVGEAFAEARTERGLELETAADDPAVRQALQQIGRSAQSLRKEALMEVQSTAQADAERLGVVGGPAAYESPRARKADLYQTIYAMFEFGHPMAHVFAAAPFYRACAALFGVCPAKLSRGIVEMRAELGDATTEKS